MHEWRTINHHDHSYASCLSTSGVYSKWYRAIDFNLVVCYVVWYHVISGEHNATNKKLDAAVLPSIQPNVVHLSNETGPFLPREAATSLCH